MTGRTGRKTTRTTKRTKIRCRFERVAQRLASPFSRNAGTGLRVALEGKRADRLAVGLLAQRGARAAVDQDLAARGLAAQPRGEVDDAADRRIVEAALEAERAERREALRDADAEVERRSRASTSVRAAARTRACIASAICAARLPGSWIGSGSLKKIRMPSPAKRSSVPLVLVDQRAHRRVVGVQHRLHLLRLGGVGERGEAAQVDEHVADLAAVRRRSDSSPAATIASATLGEKKRLRRDRRSSCATCSATRSSSFWFHPASASAWRAHLVLQRLDAQQRPHAREQLGLVDRLGQEVVGAGLDALDALLLRVERRDQHDRQQRRRWVGAEATADVVAGQARHHDVEQHEVGRIGRRSSRAPPRRWSPW